MGNDPNDNDNNSSAGDLGFVGQRHFDTLKVRAAYNPREHNNATAVPIYQTASFDLHNTARADRLVYSEEDGCTYSRISNPTVNILEQRVAELDGGTTAIAFASGMAAVTQTLICLTGNGDHILSASNVYGGTFDSFKTLFTRLGIVVDYFDGQYTAASIDAQVTERTKAIYVETISNPLNQIADLELLANVAHKHGIPLVVDNTIATPYLLRPIDFGADIVIYSATKGLSGHGNVIAGLVVESGKFDYSNGKFPQFSEERLWVVRDSKDERRTILQVAPNTPVTTRLRVELLTYLGASLGPFDASLALVGIETLSERLAKQVANTHALVDYLCRHEHVAWVSYSSLQSHPDYELAQKYTPRGAGAVFAFGIKGGKQQVDKFIDNLRLFFYSPNIGDSKSLIVDPGRTSHGELDDAELRYVGISENTLRVSVGLEDPRDLIADLEQALAAVQ
jgi:O-acetylhomoserine (thiol)-lyase